MNDVFELIEKIDSDLIVSNLDESEKEEILKKINENLPENSIVIAQTNPITGDIEGNTKKALKYIEWANRLNVEAIIFPKMYLVGLPVGDFLKKFPVIVDENEQWLEALAKFTKKPKVIISFASKAGKTYYQPAFAVLSQGKVEQIIPRSGIVAISNKKAGIVIGGETFVSKESIDYLINLSSAISKTGREDAKNRELSSLASQNKIPVVYVNQVGSGESFSFDGASRVYNNQGKLTSRAKSFEEQFLIVNPFENFGKIYPLPDKLELENSNSKSFSLDYTSDLARTYKSVVQSTRDYFHKNGFKRAVLGLSGGLDSTVCAVILADALGKDNVFGISMPSKITSDQSKNDAKILAENLGINFAEVEIKDIFDYTREKFDKIFNEIETHWDCRYKKSYTNDNIQARARATILWGVANEFVSTLPVATSDKSEFYMGYATINGDMSGGFAPIADICKTKLFALARWMNENRDEKNCIPQSIIDKKPGAELAINPETGKPLLAEEALMPYEFLDEVIWRIENLHQSIDDMVDEKFLYEENNELSRDEKLCWLEKFFRRMSCNFYKTTIIPPFPMVDAHSINRAEFTPVLTSKINFNKIPFESKVKKLSKDIK